MISRKLSIEFLLQDFLKQVDECWVASALVTEWAFDLFQRKILPNAKQHYLFGVHIVSAPNAWEKLKKSIIENPNLSARIYSKKFFHPKFYIFSTDGNFVAFVGSGNFSKGGLSENEELFIKIQDQDLCQGLIDWFSIHYEDGHDITIGFIESCRSIYRTKSIGESESNNELALLIDRLNNNFNLDNIDFSGQFFDKIHHLTFAPEKIYLDNLTIKTERERVRKRMFDLHDLIIQEFPDEWNIHQHYDTEHIVSSIDPFNHPEHKIDGIWIAYGRDRDELKRYRQDATPLLFMRLQVIIHYDSVGIWLMPGKKDGSVEDRTYFSSRIKNDQTFRQSFFDLLSGLGSGFFISVAGTSTQVSNFKDSSELTDFVLKDDWQFYYFVIGKNYPAGSPELSLVNIAGTVISIFSLLMPFYRLMKDKTFE
jgi:hypothetical protein